MLQLKQENLNHPSFEPRFIIWVKPTEDRAFLWGLPYRIVAKTVTICQPTSFGFFKGQIVHKACKSQWPVTTLIYIYTYMYSY